LAGLDFTDQDSQTMNEPNCGHRKRLIERFTKNGLDGFHDYEILELALTFFISRRDTKPIARELLSCFGSISAVLNAPVSELAKMSGMGERTAVLLSAFREISSYCLKEKYSRMSVIERRSDVEEFLRFNFGMKRGEYVAAVFLDTGNRCIATEILAEGTVNQCVVYPRKVIERGLTFGAAGFILAHNHPGGACVPSKADWNITGKLHTAGSLLDMHLLDHFIITGERIISLRDLPQWPAG
jgi:DNA repair protein RadC